MLDKIRRFFHKRQRQETLDDSIIVVNLIKELRKLSKYLHNKLNEIHRSVKTLKRGEESVLSYKTVDSTITETYIIKRERRESEGNILVKLNNEVKNNPLFLKMRRKAEEVKV